MTCNLLRGYLDKSTEHPRGGTADFLPRLACALHSMEWRSIAYAPRRACEYALSLLDLPAQRRRTRSHNVQLWADAIDMQQRIRGSVEDRYPADPDALLAELEREREMRRHEASDEAIARRAAGLDGNGFESDGYIIRPAATVREIANGTFAVQLCQGHCPIQHVAGDFPQLCDAETQAFSRLLDVHVQRLATLAGGEHVCTTHIPVGMPTIRPGARAALRK